VTSTLPLAAVPRRGLSPWALPLLLPVVPLLVRLASGRPSPKSVALLGILGLITLGIFCAAVLPAWLDRLGWAARKEAEQLRPAWLAALFAAQLPLLGGRPEEDASALLVFAATSVLVAALTFGAEFQQRTVPGLLSHPIDRRRLWNVKMSVLAAALALHLAAFVSAALVVGASRKGLLVLPVLGIAVLLAAWTATPWWTLLTRTLLAGLVFSVATPLLGVAGLFALADWALPRPWRAWYDPALATAGYVVGCAYSVLTYRAARRRWLRLEAPDLPGGEGGGAFLGTWKVLGAARRWRSPWFSLAGKELRLQFLTLATLAATLVALAVREALPPPAYNHELATAFVVLFGGVTVLLAGAAPIAEERSLGTLDSHVLLPVSRSAQWRLKLGLAAGLALVPVLALAVAFRDLSFTPSLIVPITALAYAFVLPLLASSGCASTLRALLLGLGLATFALVLVFVLTGLLVQIPNRWVADLIASATREPETWLSRAAGLSPGDLEVLMRRSANVSSRWLAGALLAPSIPALLLAGFFAGRNFRTPSGAAPRLGRQAAACLTVLLVAYLAAAAAYLGRCRGQVTAMNLLSARATLDLDGRLSSTERELLNLLRGQPRGLGMSPFATLLVRAPRLPMQASSRMRPPPPPAPPGAPPVEWFNHTFTFPLSPEQRAILIEHGYLPDTLRDGFRREAIAAGQPVSAIGSGNPPGPWPAPPTGDAFPINTQSWMHRYGWLTDDRKPGFPADAPQPDPDPTPAVPGSTPNPPPP
jgi:hypothetical protein